MCVVFGFCLVLLCFVLLLEEKRSKSSPSPLTQFCYIFPGSCSKTTVDTVLVVPLVYIYKKKRTIADNENFLIFHADLHEE